jgi:hypothetical protein
MRGMVLLTGRPSSLRGIKESRTRGLENSRESRVYLVAQVECFLPPSINSARHLQPSHVLRQLNVAAVQKGRHGLWMSEPARLALVFCRAACRVLVIQKDKMPSRLKKTCCEHVKKARADQAILRTPYRAAARRSKRPASLAEYPTCPRCPGASRGPFNPRVASSIVLGRGRPPAIDGQGFHVRLVVWAHG